MTRQAGESDPEASPRGRGFALPAFSSPSIPPEGDGGERRSQEGSIRTLAARLYIKIRERKSHGDALDAMASRPGAPELKVIRGWASADRWEDLYEKRRLTALLSAEEMKADYRVQRLTAQLKNHDELLAAAYDRAMASKKTTGAITVPDIDVYAKAWAGWKSCLDLLWDAEQAFRSRVENQLVTGSGERKAVLIRELIEEYGDKGPQYRHLVDLLASVTVRMEQMEASGRAEANSDFVELVKTRLSVIGQLQKYTEASKSLALKDDVNKMAVEMIKIAQNIFGHYSKEWMTFVNEVDRAVQEREAVA